MRLAKTVMYERFKASDARYDGRFFTGVLTTGVYCLPSCRARKPRPENVRFFPSCEAARAAGFRACRKCRPDDFARGADPVLETVETVVAEVRANPAGFADTASMVRRSGFGTTRFFELARQHYHRTPADLLLDARLERARRLLEENEIGVAEAASEAGFEAVSAFHEHFRERCAMTPAAYRGLRSARNFTLELPKGYPLPYLRRALSRDPQSVTERWSGNRYEAAVRIGNRPVLIALAFDHPDQISVAFDSRPPRGGRPNGQTVPAHPGEPSHAEVTAYSVHPVVNRLLGLDSDAAGFSRLARRLGFARLVKGREGLRITRTPTAFDGLVWSIIGQQINFPFACALRRRLTEACGEKLENGLYAPPGPAELAALEPGDLKPLKFSRTKAEYLIGAARLVAEKKLEVENLGFLSATRAERLLLGIRGIGPWSANYLMMRSLGFNDCVPLGDTGVASALRVLFGLEARPDADATRRLMAVFSPYRSLATYHLWQLLQSPP